MNGRRRFPRIGPAVTMLAALLVLPAAPGLAQNRRR